ncbi:MAG: hypothetical protein JXR43_04835 [Burkholderiaceae bacterium]|nr:hypothetical protein [Burkholderiaceae bacterium]
MSTMTNQKKIVADLQSALSGQSPLSIDLYVEVLADFEDELKASLDKDADDALLCMLADDGDVAMMVIDWDGSSYRNENALKKLQAMWRHSFDTNVQTLVPILSDHISQKNLGVAGIFKRCLTHGTPGCDQSDPRWAGTGAFRVAWSNVQEAASGAGGRPRCAAARCTARSPVHRQAGRRGLRPPAAGYLGACDARLVEGHAATVRWASTPGARQQDRCANH